MDGAVSTYPPPLANMNPNYMVMVSGNDELGNSINIIASAPEEFSLDVNSDWTPLLGGLVDKIIGEMGPKFQLAADTMKMMGTPLQNTFMTQQTWNSTSPLELKIPLKLNQVYDARQEVTIPTLQLLSLCLPSTADTGSTTIDAILPLLAPGPSLAPSSICNISVSIGRVLKFTNVIVTGVSAVFTTLPTAQGDFIACDIDLSIRTSRIITKKALLDMFAGVMPTPQRAAGIPTPASRASYGVGDIARNLAGGIAGEIGSLLGF